MVEVKLWGGGALAKVRDTNTPCARLLGHQQDGVTGAREKQSYLETRKPLGLTR